MGFYIGFRLIKGTALDTINIIEITQIFANSWAGIVIHCLLTEAHVCVWTTCQGLLPDSRMAKSQTYNL